MITEYLSNPHNLAPIVECRDLQLFEFFILIVLNGRRRLLTPLPKSQFRVPIGIGVRTIGLELAFLCIVDMDGNVFDFPACTQR
jgi:hypothetical protein